VISLQYRYFLDDIFFADTIYISVAEAQLRLVGLLDLFTLNPSKPYMNCNFLYIAFFIFGKV
jgi:hypothetical protein